MELRVDADADAGYVALTTNSEVACTSKFSNSVLVDVDAAGQPVGIELLTLNGVVVDVDGICMRYDLPDTIRDELRSILGGESS